MIRTSKEILKSNVKFAFVFFLVSLYPTFGYFIAGILGSNFLGSLAILHFVLLLIIIPAMSALSGTNLSEKGYNKLLMAIRIINVYIVLYILSFVIPSIIHG
jgi:hypothetical protein